jgi:organic hydroperoxide reductase OsmC/OhrA
MSGTTHPTTPAAAGGSRQEEPPEFTLTLDGGDGYEQIARFDLESASPLIIDEPAPLGGGAAPNPARLLGAAIGSCLGASLLFCLRKARIDVRGVHTTVHGSLVRNERGRLRVGRVAVRLEPMVPAEQHDRIPRCVEVFEDFCIVTASVRQGIDVEVEVVPRDA